MHQRDYILRIIEQLGGALAELRRRILRRERGGGVRVELAATASQAGVDVELLRGFDLSTLHLLVTPTGEVDPTRCWLMAEVLYLDGLETALSDVDDDGRESLLKARALYELIRPFGGMLVGMPEAAERIAEIDARLAPQSGETPGRARPRRRHARPHAPGPASIGRS